MHTDLRTGRSADSITEFAQIIRMENVNGAGRLFGGHLMVWMDEIAAVSARRYAKGPVTTACVENLRFLHPAYRNETLVVTGRVIYTGKTSMEVLVTAEVERYSGERELIADSHVILVALDENDHPCAVPVLVPETDLEKTLFEEANIRHKNRIK
ncbi:MAG: acyl-CoA thioesterase [Clostridia bacterium]|nr:acyl-CoA thioesterase [Clostridia bacterium]